MTRFDPIDLPLRRRTDPQPPARDLWRLQHTQMKVGNGFEKQAKPIPVHLSDFGRESECKGI